MKPAELKNNLDKIKKLQVHLYENGFLLTNNNLLKGKNKIDKNAYPFYGNWNVKNIDDTFVWMHKGAKTYIAKKQDRTILLIGHAYNPFTMQYKEQEIIKDLLKKYGTEQYQDTVNSLTGVFFLCVFEKGRLDFQLDASGMQYACYGKHESDWFITSHMRLTGDIWNLDTDVYVKDLINYRWYKYMMGNYLPGDLTCYACQKRVIPNTSVRMDDNSFKVTRFYPFKPINMCKTEQEYKDVINTASKIMQNTMSLIPKKWRRPAISLTGGIDSNTTFAAANGNYKNYETFSYISMDRESVDAEKAAEISKNFNVKHTIYNVPEENNQIEFFEVYKAIFERNGGDIGKAKDDDTRKKIVLIQNDVCDVEVKSWISETIRAYAYKYFGREKMPAQLKPRDYTSLYKIFLGNRALVHKTDNCFRQYLNETNLKSHLFNYDESDFFVWEMMHGGKCGLNIGVMRSCFDITIPYNNRKLLDILLKVPLQKRISDQHHLDLKKIMNSDLYEMGIRVVNLNETSRRKKAINAYYIINTHMPL